MKVSFYTLGCKVNQYESEAMSELFENRGYSIVKPSENPDILIVNSCTVTAESSRKTRQQIHKYRKLYPNCVIVLTGCMSQAFPEESAKILEADIILGNTEYLKIVDICEEFIAEKTRKISINSHLKGEIFEPLSVSNFSERTRAYIKIEDGCDRFCSYCIIPTARGRVRSKSLELIKKEAENLANKGFQEIVLVGINLSDFGKDTKCELGDAVLAVAEINGIKRIRLGSLEPDQISERTFKILSNCEKFCPQFHLSLQSGCDKTLKNMNRHYNSEFYENLVSQIRRYFENPSITTDIMVGFAGETEEDFIDSLNFCKKIGFARSHVFAYSIRKGTAAEKLSGHVTNSVKESRSRIMIEAMQKCESDFCNSEIGKTVSVLFETESDGYFEGYSENYTKIKVKADENLQGQILNVKITEAHPNYCIGTIN